MGKMDLPASRQVMAVSKLDRRRSPFPNAIEAEHRSALKGARKKSGGGVGLVMLSKEQGRQMLGLAAGKSSEFFFYHRLQIQLLFEPYRHCGKK